MTERTGTLDSFAREQARLEPAPRWLGSLREASLERFRTLGFPTPRQEEWRFTNVAPIARLEFAPADPGLADGARVVLPSWERAEAVCVNGRFVEALARRGGLPAGVRIESLARLLANEPAALESRVGSVADAREHPFTALNTAFLADGVFVYVPKGVKVELPVRIAFATVAPEAPDSLAAASPAVTSPAAPVTHPRVLVVVEEGASVSLIEDYEAASPGQGLANAVTEILLGPGASAEHTSVLEGSTGGFHVGTVYVRQAAASRFTARTFALGGRLVRRDVRVVFAGEEAESSLDGLYVVTGTEHVDHHTLVDHAVPHCTSRELYKGVVGGESRAVWNGAVVIRPDAQKSDAAQSNMNLLLSADATVNTKPELQIFADDVKCSHGATVGQLDDDQLFYLRARGIGEASARALLTQAFAREIVERVSHDALRADLDARVARRMEAVANVGGAQ
ncbi:MAG: Fe-S cluster assembly protein SufD [Candidatus Eiseniibacteriota bacterium]